jgi:hypothetical protein
MDGRFYAFACAILGCINARTVVDIDRICDEAFVFFELTMIPLLSCRYHCPMRRHGDLDYLEMVIVVVRFDLLELPVNKTDKIKKKGKDKNTSLSGSNGCFLDQLR